MIIVSACLTGCNCRYDGKNNYIEAIDILINKGLVVRVCPEQEGGMPTPRVPCERIKGTNIILNKNNEDKTKEFILGAKRCIEKIKNKDINIAILKAKSPSCGYGKIYNGKFEGKLIPGKGIFAELLNNEGVEIFNEENFLESEIIKLEINK